MQNWRAVIRFCIDSGSRVIHQGLGLIDLHHRIHQGMFHRLEKSQGMIKLLSGRTHIPPWFAAAIRRRR